ncbi:hypothetical protein EON67_09575, partial [archaeon]
LSKEGAVFAAGSEAFGQCGTGKTGEYIVTAGRSAFTHEESFSPVLPLTGMRIKDIACGANHTVALEADGLVYTWGAGGYGRCGHGDAKDVLIPTLVKAFEAPRFRVSTIAAGATCTYAVQTLTKALMFFGIAKRSGDATLAPKMVMDLAGYVYTAWRASRGTRSARRSAQDKAHAHWLVCTVRTPPSRPAGGTFVVWQLAPRPPLWHPRRRS